MTTTTTSTVKTNATVWDATNTAKTRQVVATNDIKLNDGEFVIESHLGCRVIGVLTGRTRKFWGIDCPTILRFDIDTVVIDGAIWGVRGEAIAGTFAVRPENIA